MFSGSTLLAASQSVALLQARHELRIGDGEHAVLPLSGDKLVADFIAIPGSALRNQFGFSGILRDPCGFGLIGGIHCLRQLGGSPQQKPGVTTNALRRKASFRVPTLLGGNQS
jgi:hypothetical protein